MSQILLNSKVLQIIAIKKKTSAVLFKDLKIGDLIQISVPVEKVGTSRGRSYSVNLKITHLKDNSSVLKTFNEISSILSCFDLLEC